MKLDYNFALCGIIILELYIAIAICVCVWGDYRMSDAGGLLWVKCLVSSNVKECMSLIGFTLWNSLFGVVISIFLQIRTTMKCFKNNA